MVPPIVKRYLLALGRYKWAIPLGLFVGTVGGAVLTLQQTEEPIIYTATGVVAYTRPPVSFSTTGSQIQTQGEELGQEFLLGDNIIRSAAATAEINPKTLGKNVKLTLPKKPKPGEAPPPRLINVSYSDTEDERAAIAVEALMKGMIEQSRQLNTARLKAVIDSINQRLPKAKQELKLAEQRLELYDRQEGPAILAAQNGSLVNAISASREQQRQTRLALQGIEAQISSLQRKLGLTPQQAFVSSALSADPIIANLRSQIYQTESQLTILSRDLRPEHPNIISLQRQRQAYEELLQQRAAEVIGGNGVAAPLAAGQIRQESSLDPTRQQLANTMGTLQTQRETFQQQLLSIAQSEQQLRNEYTNIPNKQLERARLEQQLTLKKTLHDQIQAKLVDAQTAEAETVSSLSIAQPAQIIASEAKPKQSPVMTLGIGILVGLVVGGGLVFLLDMLEGTFYTPEELREAIRQRDVNVLGTLPFLVISDMAADDLPAIIAPDSPYLEAYERLRSNLRRLEEKNLKMVLLTSTIAQEGKSVCAYNLAIASARAGKRTLLIEANLRSASNARSLKVAPDPDSVIEPLRYYGQLNDCIRLVPDVENLYVAPSPGSQRQAAAILESSEMRRLLEDVRGRFDLVILDTPSLSLCNDALLLEPYTDGMLLVTRPGYTQESLLAEALDQLTESDDIRLLGAIINGVDSPVSREVIAPEAAITLEAHPLREDLESEDELEKVPSGKST